MAFDQIGYIAEYNKANYDVIRATVPKGRGKEIKAFAKAQGKSVSQLIVDALENCYKLVLVNVYGNEIDDVKALTEHDIIVNWDPT
mgnify:CR=1 FL=1